MSPDMSPDMTIQAEADRRWLREAIKLSRRCPPSGTAYSVGAIIVAGDGTRLADGYSRDVDPHVHAEESALAALARSGPSHMDLPGATIYSSLEPCSSRRSRPRTCTHLILAAGIGRVVFALREPPLLADCHGAELLRQGGVEVVEIGDMARLVREVNAHLFTTQDG
ncbi:dCMP deaminase [Sphaerimonospora cavernae]|uniref:dCMP deaminase n=1 Tax=Sphaerimonospora cavernae TaxID=1740611 RepID=A0ABV6U476_9ACTN